MGKAVTKPAAPAGKKPVVKKHPIKNGNKKAKELNKKEAAKKRAEEAEAKKKAEEAEAKKIADVKQKAEDKKKLQNMTKGQGKKLAKVPIPKPAQIKKVVETKKEAEAKKVSKGKRSGLLNPAKTVSKPTTPPKKKPESSSLSGKKIQSPPKVKEVPKKVQQLKGKSSPIKPKSPTIKPKPKSPTIKPKSLPTPPPLSRWPLNAAANARIAEVQAVINHDAIQTNYNRPRPSDSNAPPNDDCILDLYTDDYFSSDEDSPEVHHENDHEDAFDFHNLSRKHMDKF